MAVFLGRFLAPFSVFCVLVSAVPGGGGGGGAVIVAPPPRTVCDPVHPPNGWLSSSFVTGYLAIPLLSTCNSIAHTMIPGSPPCVGCAHTGVLKSTGLKRARPNFPIFLYIFVFFRPIFRVVFGARPTKSRPVNIAHTVIPHMSFSKGLHHGVT